MWNIVISSICNRRSQVCHLQRRTAQLSLTNRERQHRQTIPRATITLVVELSRRHRTGALAYKVRIEFTAITKTLHIVGPHLQTLLYATIFAIFYYITEHIAEIGITRLRYGISQIQRRGVGVTLLAYSSHVISQMARICLRGGQHTLLQTDKALHQLKRRARRILRLHGTIKERITLIAQQTHIVIASFTAYQLIGVESRR